MCGRLQLQGWKRVRGFNRNMYNNRVEALAIDNPFQAVDAPVLSGVGGPAADHIVMAPDNEASTQRRFLLKFARQTRIGGAVSMATWTQDAAFSPYTSTRRSDARGTRGQQPLHAAAEVACREVTERYRHLLVLVAAGRGPGHPRALPAYDQTEQDGPVGQHGRCVRLAHTTGTSLCPPPDVPFGHGRPIPTDTTTSKFDGVGQLRLR